MKIAKINSYTPNSYRVLQNQNTNQKPQDQNNTQNNRDINFGNSKEFLAVAFAAIFSGCAPGEKVLNEGADAAEKALVPVATKIGHTAYSRGQELREMIDGQNIIIRKCREDLHKPYIPRGYEKLCKVLSTHLERRKELKSELDQFIADSIMTHKHDSILANFIHANEKRYMQEDIQKLELKIKDTNDPQKKEELKAILKALKAQNNN